MKTISLFNYVNIVLCSAVLLLVACTDKEKLAHDDADHVTRCLMAKDYKYEDLLTKADIAKHVTIDESSYKMEISTTKGLYGFCSYE